MKPIMNYPIEFELNHIGGWSCTEIRLGTYKCDCECKHGNKICEHCQKTCTKEGRSIPRPSTIYEKLNDSFKILEDFWEALKVYDKPFPRIADVVKKYTKQELRTGICILKFQCQAYRKILFAQEHRLIYSLCKYCNQKRFFYRLPNWHFHSRFGADYQFPVSLTHLNTLFHCTKCHLVMFEDEIGRVEYREPSGYQKYIKSKQGLFDYLSDMSLYQRPVLIQDYYEGHESKLKRRSMKKFFITKNNQYTCIGCNMTYKRIDLAKKHWRRFWGMEKDHHKNWIGGCMLGVKKIIHDRNKQV